MPAILEWPGKIEPSRTSFMTTTSDMMPTLLAMVASKYKSTVPLDGMNIQSQLQTANAERSGYLFFAWQRLFNEVSQQAIMDNRYKYIFDAGQEALYDLQEDPTESKNLIERNKKKTLELKSALEEWKKSTLKSREGADFKY